MRSPAGLFHHSSAQQLEELFRSQAPIAGRPIVESFRLLALNIQRLLEPEPRRCIAVLSAWPADGRSLAAAALARALAELTPPVLLVDADPAGSGINGSMPPLRAKKRPDEFAIEAGGDLSLKQLQRLVPEKNGLTTQAQFLAEVQGAIEQALRSQMTVVVDTPACTSSSVAFHIAACATGVLYVARNGSRDQGIHRDIRAQLDLLGVRVLGVAFNEG